MRIGGELGTYTSAIAGRILAIRRATTMARQAWESTVDDEFSLRSSGSGFLVTLSRWLLGLVIVGALTAGAAYYLPLLRAHRALSERYVAMQKRTDVQDGELRRLKASLAGVEADRQRLKEERSQLLAKERADKERDAKLRDVLSTKLAGFSKAHLSVVAREGAVAVMVSPAVVRMQGAELSDAGRSNLCSIVKAMSSVGPLSYRLGAYVAHAAATAPGPREEAAGRATNVAKALEEDCAVPGTRILSAGFLLPVSGDSALASDVLELDVAELDAMR
jgi:hypothetical protein